MEESKKWVDRSCVVCIEGEKGRMCINMCKMMRINCVVQEFDSANVS